MNKTQHVNSFKSTRRNGKLNTSSFTSWKVCFAKKILPNDWDRIL